MHNLNLKTNFTCTKKTNKLYKLCKDCFNKKVLCGVCNTPINKTYLKRHIKVCKIKFGSGIKNNIENNNSNENTKLKCIDLKKDSDENLFKLRENENAKLRSIDLKDVKHRENNELNIENENNMCDNNRTLIVGPSFCGKTHLLINLIKIKKIDDPNRSVVIITRSPEQYTDIDLDIEIENDFENKSISDFEDCIIVFDDMLDSNQKLIDPFFTRGRHRDIDVYYLAQSYK